MPITLPYSAPMTAKRAALAAEITAVLAAHEAGWKVATRFELGAERPGGSKAERDRLMGSPVRYCRVASLGRASRGEDSSDLYGAARQVGHVFAVYLWRTYADNATNQSIWDAVLEGHDPDGVLVHLNGLGALPNVGADLNGNGGEVAYVGQPEDVIVPDEPLYLGDEDFAWYAQFFITLT